MQQNDHLYQPTTRAGMRGLSAKDLRIKGGHRKSAAKRRELAVRTAREIRELRTRGENVYE